MGRLSLWPAVLGLSLAMILVTVVKPVENSMAFASAGIVLIALLGWVMEARAIAGAAPEVEPEEEEEEEAPGPSYWPLILAMGVVGIAAGLVYSWDYGALIVAVPLALGSAAAWGHVLKLEMESTAVPEAELMLGPPLLTSGGRVLMPVAGTVLAAQAAGGAAIAIERAPAREISRRNVLRLTFWAGLGAGLLTFAAGLVNLMYPRGIKGFGGVVSAGTVDQFLPGTKTPIPDGKFWLVNLTAEQGGPGFLALWWKCPHLGCTVPWRADFTFPDPATGQDKKGWFRCPCHGSTYNDAGVRVFGPAPRPMDHFDLTIDPSTKRISVNTGKVTKGTPDNPTFAVKAP